MYIAFQRWAFGFKKRDLVGRHYLSYYLNLYNARHQLRHIATTLSAHGSDSTVGVVRRSATFRISVQSPLGTGVAPGLAGDTISKDNRLFRGNGLNGDEEKYRPSREFLLVLLSC